MKTLFTLLALTAISLPACQAAARCPGTCLDRNGNTCLKKSQVPAWMAGKMGASTACFSYKEYNGGAPVCWYKTGGYAPCNAFNPVCGYAGSLQRKTAAQCKLSTRRGIGAKVMFRTH